MPRDGSETVFCAKRLFFPTRSTLKHFLQLRLQNLKKLMEKRKFKMLRPQTDTKPSVGRQEPPDETGIITGNAAQKRKLQELVSVAKNRVAEERRELEHKKNQRQDAAMEKAAMACMGAAARKIRLVGKQKPKCFKACHGVWHCEGCPNHHRNVSIAKKALARRAFKVRIAQTFCASLGQLLINRCFFTVSWVSFCFSLKIQKKV